MQRCLYAIPDNSIFHNDEMVKLEKDAEESKISPSGFQTKLHVSCFYSSSFSRFWCFYLFGFCLTAWCFSPDFFFKDVASGLKNEVAKHLLNLNVSSFTMAPVKVCRFSQSDSLYLIYALLNLVHHFCFLVLFWFILLLFFVECDQISEAVCIREIWHTCWGELCA